MEHWEVKFRQFVQDKEMVEIDAIPCEELIASWTDISEEERNTVKKELLFEK